MSLIEHKESATINGQFIRNESTVGYAPVTETGIVPAGLVLETSEAIAPDAIVTATIDGAPAEIVPWGYSLQAGEIAVDRPRGLLRFATDDVGGTVSVTYSGVGTVLTAAKIATVGGGAVPQKKHYHFDSPTTIPNDADVVTIEGGFEEQYQLPSVQDYPQKSIIIGLLTGFDILFLCQPGEHILYSASLYPDIAVSGGSTRTLVGVPSRSLWLMCHAD